jgi:hypothetical protein
MGKVNPAGGFRPWSPTVAATVCVPADCWSACLSATFARWPSRLAVPACSAQTNAVSVIIATAREQNQSQQKRGAGHNPSCASQSTRGSRNTTGRMTQNRNMAFLPAFSSLLFSSSSTTLNLVLRVHLRLLLVLLSVPLVRVKNGSNAKVKKRKEKRPRER